MTSKAVRAAAAIGAVLLLGACAQTGGGPKTILGGGPSAAERNGAAALVDPKTGRIDPRWLDTSFSLADVVDERLGGRLDRNDRRFIDATLDQALAEASDAPARSWSNPANGHAGRVDLMTWLIDHRANEACAIINHTEVLGAERLEGSVTLCRAATDPGWRVDTASWTGPDRAIATPLPPAPPRPAAVARRSAPTTQPEPSPPLPQRKSSVPGAAVGSPAASAPSAPAGTPKAETVSEAPIADPSPTPTITEPPAGDIIPNEPGMQNLGDRLQDRSPHIEAN